jgi:amino acid adenylation domain-containing protein
MSDEHEYQSDEATAIVGMAGRFPGARDIDEFWCNLRGGVDSISHFTDAELEPSHLESPGARSLPEYVKARGIVEGSDKFDAEFFGFTPREASVMDPQHRLFLEASWTALEHSGYDPAAYDGAIGVWAGGGLNTYLLENVLPRRDVVEQLGLQQTLLANERDYMPTRVSYKLNLRGPSIAVGTGCSTSLVAVCLAHQALLGYQCDMALAGGAYVMAPQRQGYVYREGAILSPDGRCRPFDAEAAGTVFSEGVGVVALKRLEDAQKDGDTVYAVIKGAALNNDGSGKVSFTAPSVDAQAEVVAMAQAIAGVEPETISYVEAHGTATPLGDPIEVAALTQAFRTGTSAKGFCAIGSVKGNVGHLDAAAGVAGLIKTALALHHKSLPPSLHFKRPNPQIDFANSPFFVNTELRPWTEASGPRRAGVSSLGVGGTNAHVVLEEAPTGASAKPARAEQLLVLSARTAAALDEASANLARHLREHPETSLANVAYTLQEGRRGFRFRRAVVSRNATEAAAALETEAPHVHSGTRGHSDGDADLVFLFPGQGAQRVGMTSSLYRSEPVFRVELDECAEVLQPHLDLDIRTILYSPESRREEAEHRLAETGITQPVLFAVEYALARLWMSWGLTPAAMIGHSLGEYVAACVAGAMSRDTAARLVATRSRLMQAQPRGMMLSVRLPAEELAPQLGPEVELAGLNAPELTVVAGPESAVRSLEARLVERDVSCRPVATSHAAHSAAMDGMLEPFRDVLASVPLKRPSLPWVSGLTGDWITPEQAIDPDYWVQQLRQPVRFSEGVRRLALQPNRALLEVGPGHILSTLACQHRDRPAGQAVVTSLGEEPEREVASILEAVGRLWIAGLAPDWDRIRGDEPRRRVPLPTYPFERRRCWVDPAPIPESWETSSPAMPTISSQDSDEAASIRETADVAPEAESEVRASVRRLLSGASGIPVAEIDDRRSFLEMGFDSLLLGQVASKIERHFDVSIAFRQLIEDWPTPDALSSHLEARPGAELSPVAAGDLVDAALVSEAVPSGSFPLSEAQKEIWAVVQMGPQASCSYNVCFALRVAGEVSAEAMREAAQAVLERHEAFRMTFDAEGHSQAAGSKHPVEVPLVDLSELQAPSRQAGLDGMLRDEVRTPFDLAAGPPARARLVRMAADELIVVFTGHHIICDGWSVWLFFEELATVYAASRREQTASLPPAPTFGGFIRRTMDSDGLARADAARAYWRSRFAHPAPPLELPLDRPRPSEKTYRASREGRMFDPALHAAVKRDAGQRGTTTVGFLLAAYYVLLARLTGQTDIVVGVPASARDHAEERSLVGHATNFLPLRVQLDMDASVATLLGVVRTALLDAQEHRDLTFGTLVRELNLPRDLSRTPLVATLFNADSGRIAPSIPDTQTELLVPPRAHLNFELEMQVLDLGRDLLVECTYDRDLFSAETVKRWLAYFEALLEGMIADPAASIGALQILAEEEREELQSWNATETEVPKACVHELIRSQVERRPGKVALVCGDRTVTYGELDGAANRLARALRERGVGRGTLVGLCLERSPEMVVALLAVLKAGGAYVPLDPDYPVKRLGLMIEDSGLEVLVSETTLRGLLPEDTVPVLWLDEEAQALAALDGSEIPHDDRRARPEDPAYVIYTSGSTGTPKGVSVPHRSVVNLLESVSKRPGMTSEDIVLAVTTLSFDIAVSELILPLFVGACVVIASREVAADGAQLLATLERHRASFLDATPTTWRMLLESGWKGSPGLKAICTGEAMPRDLALELVERVASLWNGYGPTETTVWSTFEQITPPVGSILIGRPIANTQTYVLDARRQLVPVGVTGELYIGGAGVTLGYLDRPELTAERFVEDPFSKTPGAKMYRTGDLARWLPDGRLECLGRIDHQVKVRGFRIELGEIEAALGGHEGIKQVVVVARDFGPSDTRLVAYVVSEDGAGTSALREHLSKTLPEYMVPSAFIPLESLPLTPSGKLDRRALPEPEGLVSREGEYVAPRTPTEEILAGIWAEVLGAQRVGATDDFFALGGHSLLAMQVVSRAREALGVELQVQSIFGASTLERLADHVEKTSGQESAPLRPAPRGERTPLSSIQRRLWFFERLEPGTATYHLGFRLRLEGRLDRDALGRSLDELVARHDALRTRFGEEDGEPFATVAKATSVPIPCAELGETAADELEKEAVRLLDEAAREPFDLEKGPLFRLQLVRLGEDRHLLGVTIHHIVSDGWSIGIFIEELARAYRAFSGGEKPDLQRLPVSYGDYAVWEQDWQKSPAAERQLSYWREQLSGPMPVVDLPQDFPRAPSQTYRGSGCERRLSVELTRKITELSSASAVTPFMTLLAAFGLLLHRLTGLEDLPVGVATAGRSRKGTEDLLGVFINTVVIRHDLSGEPTFAELLRRTRTRALEAYRNADISFDRIVEELRPPRDPARTPLFQVLLNSVDFGPQERLELPGLTITQVESGVGDSKFDVTLYAEGDGDAMNLVLSYNADLYRPERKEALLEQLETLLEQVASEPEQAISEYSLLAPSAEAVLPDAKRPLAIWEGPPVTQALLDHARGTPGRTVVSDPSTSLDYATLDDLSRGLATKLQRSGVSRGDLVALYGRRSAELVWGVLGVLRAGAGFVILDADQPASRTVECLGLARPRAWLETPRAGAEGDDLEDTLDRLDLTLRAELLETRGRAEEPEPDRGTDAPGPDEIAYVAFTSGTSGGVKGIVGTHGPLAHFVSWHARTFGFTAEDRFAMLSGLAHDPLLRDILTPLHVGARLCVPDPDIMLAPSRLRGWMAREAVTVVHITPSLARVLVEGAKEGELADLRYVFSGGEVLTRDLVWELRRVGPSITVVNLYGATETPQGMAWYVVPEEERGEGEAAAELEVPLGRGIDDVQLLILGKGGRLAGIGELGEIAVRTPHLARGYLADEALTRERFVANPFTQDPTDRIYLTGDLGRYRPDGLVDFAGRADGQVKVRGHRVETGEIEAMLVQAEDVREAAVVARSVDPSDVRLVAYVVPEDGTGPSLADLRRRLRATLPDYMVPSTFALLESLPLTPNGKVDRKALPAPELLGRGTAAREEPRTEMEHRVARLWSELLGAEVVGRHENFFDLGGHSLLAMRMIHRLEVETGARLNPRQLLYQTLEQVAAVCEQKAGSAEPSVATAGRARATGWRGLLGRLLGA